MQALLSANPLPSLRRSVKTPVVYQAEAAECGLACLCMILQAHGDKRTLAELRQEYGLSLKGATLGDIITIAKRLSLSARALKLDLDDLPKLQLPCVVHWDMKHFVVLTAVNKNSVTIHDPATGKRKMPVSRFSAHFTGIALELSPAPAFTPVTATPKLTISSFFSGLSGLRRTLLLTFCITLLIQLFALLSPYYMQMVVDDALPAGSSDFLTALTIGFALFLLIECLTSALRQHILLHFTSRLQLLMSARVFSHLLQLPLKWFHSRHTGDIISRFSSLNALRDFLTASFITVIMDGLMALVTVAVMYVYAPLLATVVIVITFLYALFRVFAWHCVRPHHADKLELASKEQTHFIESMRAIQTIKQFNLEASRHGHWLNRLTSSLNADISIGKWGLRTSIAKQVITGAENIVVIYLGAQMAMENALTTGMLYAFISYKNRFVTAAESLITTALEWRMLSLHIDRLSDVVLAECEDVPVAFSGADGTDNAGPATLSLRQVSYAYDSFSAPVLENINLTVAPGEAIGHELLAPVVGEALDQQAAGLWQPADLALKRQPLGGVGGQAGPAGLAEHAQDAVRELRRGGELGAHEGGDLGLLRGVAGDLDHHVAQALVAHDLATDEEGVALAEGGGEAFLDLAQRRAATAAPADFQGVGVLDRADVLPDARRRARVAQLPEPVRAL